MSDCDFCNPMDFSLPGSSAHGSFQAGKLDWVDISFSRGSFRPRDQIHISWLAAEFFTTEPPGKVQTCTITLKSQLDPVTLYDTIPFLCIYSTEMQMHVIQKLCNDVHSTTLQPNLELKKTQMSKRVKLGNKL